MRKCKFAFVNVLLFPLISRQYTRNGSAADEKKERKSETGVIVFVLEELVEKDPDQVNRGAGGWLLFKTDF